MSALPAEAGMPATALPAVPGLHPPRCRAAGRRAAPVESAVERTGPLWNLPVSRPVVGPSSRVPAGGHGDPHRTGCAPRPAPPSVPCPREDAVHHYPELAALGEGWSFRWLATRQSVLVGVLLLPDAVCTLYVNDTGTAAALLSGGVARRAGGSLADVVRAIDTMPADRGRVTAP